MAYWRLFFNWKRIRARKLLCAPEHPLFENAPTRRAASRLTCAQHERPAKARKARKGASAPLRHSSSSSPVPFRLQLRQSTVHECAHFAERLDSILAERLASRLDRGRLPLVDEGVRERKSRVAQRRRTVDQIGSTVQAAQCSVVTPCPRVVLISGANGFSCCKRLAPVSVERLFGGFVTTS